MTVGELREKLNEYDDNLELFYWDAEYYDELEHRTLKGIKIDKYNNMWLVAGNMVEFNEADFND